MKKILLVASLLSSSLCFSQDDKQLVTDAVADYVDGFYIGDTTRIHRSISTDVVKYGYHRRKDATAYEGGPMSFRQMIDYSANVGKRPNNNVDKLVKKIEIFDVLDKTAAAKLTAWWGTDYILLAKLNGKWMITHVLWQSPPPAKTP
jgi:hypothetical protein